MKFPTLEDISAELHITPGMARNRLAAGCRGTQRSRTAGACLWGVAPEAVGLVVGLCASHWLAGVFGRGTVDQKRTRPRASAVATGRHGLS